MINFFRNVECLCTNEISVVREGFILGWTLPIGFHEETSLECYKYHLSKITYLRSRIIFVSKRLLAFVMQNKKTDLENRCSRFLSPNKMFQISIYTYMISLPSCALNKVTLIAYVQVLQMFMKSLHQPTQLSYRSRRQA
jgi:hypothetical protein